MAGCECCDNFSMIDGGDEFKAFPGLKGDDGTTFYPHVSAEGVLSWTNDGGKPNPDPVNIKGADGKSAYQAAVEAGFYGTEAEFNEYLSNIGVLTEEVANQKSAIEGKQDAPADAGTAGQVLGLDDDLNPVWLDQTGGGGGGTTNYNNLTNKPRINGVLLTGDKSAADLGLAAASDIPTIPVQSVNGETGAVVLDASDVGAVAEPQTAGTAGQVLGLDSNLNPVWVNQSGGGGTANYNDLSNKPQIDGVTLSGNKTASDLGLALASDIPAVPVQSVNGKTGAVVLSASDVSALPSSTSIPTKTSDLTNDSGFVNAAGAAAAAPVQSVNGSTGAVTVQDTITASGILKGNGSGGVSAAVAGTDYLTPATNYSQTKEISGNYTLIASDIGKTLAATTNGTTITIPLDVWSNLPGGAEIAFFRYALVTAANLIVDCTAIVGLRGCIDGTPTAIGKFKINNGYDLVALKKLGSGNSYGMVVGNVEVVS